jgi:hypothetical protein
VQEGRIEVQQEICAEGGNTLKSIHDGTSIKERS